MSLKSIRTNLNFTSYLQHVGIRGAISGWEDYQNDREVGFIISHADEIEDVGYKGIVDKIREVVGDNPVYREFIHMDGYAS